MFSMELADESDGTRKLMAIAPAIESVLLKGGLLLVDEIEKELHPALVEFIVAKFQSKKTNPNGAQIVFTTHNTDLLSMELLRKDQLYLWTRTKKMVLQNSTASAIFPLARPKMSARAISSENMARLPMSKLRRLNDGSQAKEVQGQYLCFL